MKNIIKSKNVKMNNINQKGSVMLEGLIAILIFSIGLLGMAAFQVSMIKKTSNVQYRLQSSLLINSAIAEIEANPNKLGCYVGGTCADSTRSDAWLAQVNELPGAVDNPPSISEANGIVTIIVYWSIPNDLDSSGNVSVHSMKSQTSSLVTAD